MESAKKIYCSLDIETSGFDPLVNEILEVGFVFFTISDEGVKITEKWTQVFHPERPVAPNILGLTGINLEELENAPKFSEWRDFLQQKLGNAVIVGHNIIFDLKFLEGFGLKFSGQSIDTLDLVQWLLPTHHSYNLENLMHTFGIAHKEAHRALADSIASLKLLEKLLRIYAGFSPELKKDIQELIKPCNFTWQPLLAYNLPPLSFNAVSVEKRRNEPPLASRLVLQPKKIYAFNLESDYITAAAQAAKKKGNCLLVVPKPAQALNLYKNKFVDSLISPAENLFNEKKFLASLKKKNLSAEEVKFLLKILVWKFTNWQTETLSELNLSFFGGQFKSMIAGEKPKEHKTAKITACDMETFLSLDRYKTYKNRDIIICGLGEFETMLVANIGSKTSWGYLTYLLKSIYNPETGIGDQKHAEIITEALTASDLFFGLTQALIQSNPPSFIYYKINAATENDEKFLKITAAAENFQKKLENINTQLKSEGLVLFLKNFQLFFKQETNRIKWIESAEGRCAFLSMPLKITELKDEVLNNFSSVTFCDRLTFEEVTKYFIQRLALENFEIIPVMQAVGKISKPKASQGDLFSGFKEAMGLGGKKVTFHFWPKNPDMQELAQMVGKRAALPAALLLPNPSLVKEFYEANYENIKKIASLLAQSNSGGSNKIFRNFSINPASLLVATDKFVLRHLNAVQAVEPVDHLSVKTLIICRLPFEQFTQPYQEAVSQSLPNPFLDYSMPRAMLNFHNLFNFFYTPELKDIYVIDQKLNKDYAQVFKEYYKFVAKGQLKA